MTSPRRTEITRFIVAFRKEHGYAPSFQEIADDANITKSVVQHHIEVMYDQGLLRRPATPGLRRSLVPTEAAMKALEELM